jgi:glycolate oxidase
MDREALIRRLEEIVGPQGVISERNQLRTYECDGLANFRVIPSVVVLPETASQAQGAVRACFEAGVPFVARGSGTGLSGGALPVSDGVLIVLARMRRVLEVDLDNARAVVEPGVLNLQVTKEVAGDGFYYAPDPSSQQVCSIGGNVAENSGGAHCLKYGFTTNHVTGLEVVLPDGELVHLGGRPPTHRATTCSAPSSAPRAPWASPPRSPCGCCASPRPSAPCWPPSTAPTRPATPSPASSGPGSCPRPSR